MQLDICEVKKKGSGRVTVFKRKPKEKEESLQEDANLKEEFVPVFKRKKSKKPLIIVLVVLLAAAAVFGVNRFLKSKSGSQGAAAYTTATVSQRDISVTLTGSGTLQPANSYDVTALVSGEVLAAPFEEGDTVEKDAVLYTIDTADVENSIKSAELSLEKSQMGYNKLLKSLDDLNVKSPAAGSIISLNVEAGDPVSGGQELGKIRNSAVMSLKVPFNSGDVSRFYVGERATVTLEGTFETVSGTVAKISSVEEVLSGNMLVKYVTIDVSNPGGITASTAATAKIGGTACNSSATFTYKSEETITASSSGTVAAVLVDEGDTVKKSQVLMKLDSSDLEQQIKESALSLQDMQLSLENKKKELGNYTITSPIAGTIIEKNYKQGDTLGSGSVSGSSNTLCTVYDLSYLIMELNVDELDVSKVEVGQTVTITADAVEGKTYEGVVTKVNINGTTSNGVTVYPVTIRIDRADGLLPGMNVDANIVVQSSANVLAIPVDAVTRGNQVLVKKSDPETQAAAAPAAGSQPASSSVPAASSPSSGKMGAVQPSAPAQSKTGTAAAQVSPGISGTLASANDIPEGFAYVDVTLGINDDDYIEVTSGLEAGDIIAIVTTKQDPAAATTGKTAFGTRGGGNMYGSGNMSGGSGGPPAAGGGMEG